MRLAGKVEIRLDALTSKWSFVRLGRQAHGLHGFLRRMGYCVYITRADDWLDSAQFPIAETEWLSVVEADPALSVNHADYYEFAIEGGGTQRIHPVEWSGTTDENCFWYDNGSIECKNPSQRWLAKMVELAALLNAHVLGEENEVYSDAPA